MVKQVRAARTRQALIDAAAEVFAEDGYAVASLPAISKRAGVSAGALHFHFPSKDALAREVETAAVGSVESLAMRFRSSADTSLQALVNVTHELLLAVTADAVIRAGFKLSGDPSRKNGAGLRQWWRTWVHELLLQAQREGELAEEVSPEGATAAIVAATVGFETLGAWDRNWVSQEYVAEFWVLVLPRLAASRHQELLVPGGTGR
ncbi:ScbR family autoregulator-binding transcription factor [Streptomyces sp. SAS_270]|uniref:ScbR family autoregulator-binding transcription factor n=1 Tax=Streptomyces sp. SAS_270 TaxID=3412748 RepID=UPI00403C7F2D